MKIQYKETASFQRDFKKLNKKFKTLDDDMDVAKRNAIELFHLSNIDNQSIVLIPGYTTTCFQIYKLRKFACRALKGEGAKSGIKIVYVYHAMLKSITFLEIYFKADQENEHVSRITQFLKSEIE